MRLWVFVLIGTVEDRWDSWLVIIPVAVAMGSEDGVEQRHPERRTLLMLRDYATSINAPELVACEHLLWDSNGR